MQLLVNILFNLVPAYPTLSHFTIVPEAHSCQIDNENLQEPDAMDNLLKFVEVR